MKNYIVKMREPQLIFAPEMEGAVKRWGVYAIPRLWRDVSGDLVVRINGEQDCADINVMNRAENLYFVSRDNGETWELDKDGESKYDISIMTGIDPAVLTLKNGEKVYLKTKKNLKPVKNVVQHTKEVKAPNGEAYLRAYPYGDIPDDCKGIYFCKVGGECTEINFDFPEREVLVNAKALTDEGDYIKVDEYLQPVIFKAPYFSGLTELSDSTFAALCVGQNPEVDDRYCSEVYLVVSEDGGKTWRKRAVVASGKTEVPFGYGGDGGEVSLTRSKDGVLIAVMRMDMSINPDIDPSFCDAIVCTSDDEGFTWSKPFSISDSSVTPHVVAFDNGAVLAIYGRPGVHCKVSADNGKSWSESYSIIGKTLEQERAAGKTDAQAKYFDTSSYSNVFYEKISDNTIVVVYTDLKYQDKMGRNTKATFVRKITVE